MVVAETIKTIFENAEVFFLFLFVSIIMSFGISRYYTGRVISGLFLAQLAFVFNLAVMLFVLAVDSLSVSRFAHFLMVELLVTVCIYSIYKRFLSKKDEVMLKIEKYISLKLILLLSAFVIFLIILNIVFVPVDGGSRIQYQTSRWFSFLRIPRLVLLPLCSFIVIYLLDKKHYFLTILLSLLLITLSATSGSKAGFLLSMIGAYLLYRDLKGGELRISPTILVGSLFFLMISTVLVLVRLGTSATDVIVRLIHNAEATIMVYLADDPTEACRDVSLLSSIHRGLARAVGDTSANNIDTLFGFALTYVHTGANTFTGPNSSVPAYVLCNFPDYLIMVALMVFVFFTIIVKKFFTLSLLHTSKVSVLLVPFVVVSINSFPQDYYSGMSALTTMAIILVLLFALEVIIKFINTGGRGIVER